jgi:hypothetical protein
MFGCIPAGQRVRLIKMAALQNMGTEPDPKRQLIHSLIVRYRAYQTKRQDGAGRGLFRKSMRWTRCAGMHKYRQSQVTEWSEEVPVITDPFGVNKILECLKRNNALPFDKGALKAS